MGIEKQTSKAGNYVGGFFQLFDWNAKSRKKLFSSKSDLPEKSKQKKRFDGTLPVTRLEMLDEDERGAGSSIKESSDYSCASSVTDDDFYGSSKAPGVVARLMGLDSLPRFNAPEPYSTPLFDCQSLPGSYYKKANNIEYHQDPQIMYSKEAPEYRTELRDQKVIRRPIQKFQTEILPRKSAKSIPITRNKLLSPIKSANSIPPKDAAHIMEAAARIIEPQPQAGTRRKLSSLPSLEVKDSKPSKLSEDSQSRGECSAVKNLRGHSRTKSWNGSVSLSSSVSIFQDLDDSSVGVKGKGKSISLALQAKANVQKRAQETNETSQNEVFTSHQSSAQKSTFKKPSGQNGSRVLRQNNQKQNVTADRGKLPLKSNLQGGKAQSGDRQGITKVVSSRKSGSETKNDKKQVSSSSSERVTCKKRSIDGNYHSEKDQAACDQRKDKVGKADQSSTNMDKPGTDVISFTFTAPMAQPRPNSGRSIKAEENYKIFSSDSPSKRTLLNSDGTSAPKFSFLGHNVKGGDTLSTFLEQQLKELSHKVEFAQQKSRRVSSTSSTMLDENMSPKVFVNDQKYQGLVEETRRHETNIFEDRMLLDCRFPSPVSILEHFPFAEGCNSTDTADSISTEGGKQFFASLQSQDVLSIYSMNTIFQIEGDTELLDSASSTSSSTVAKSRELEYVKEMLFNIEPMFKDYALGKSCEIMDPHLFDQLEKVHFNDCGLVSRIDRKLLFDCASECLDMRFRRYAGGGYSSWIKGLRMVKGKDRLAADVCKEISGWGAMGDFMVDELVDHDMGSKDGRWVDYEIEAFEVGIRIENRILDSLIDEVVADILVL